MVGYSVSVLFCKYFLSIPELLYAFFFLFCVDADLLVFIKVYFWLLFVGQGEHGDFLFRFLLPKLVIWVCLFRFWFVNIVLENRLK